VRAELAERGQAPDRAIVDYGAALALLPRDDAVRAALADVLMARGDAHEAADLLRVDRPGLALLVRRVACTRGAERLRARSQAASLLALEAARGDALHHRETALLALAEGDAARALQAAEKNFATQRELPDVRVLARAAVAAGDEGARARLWNWLRTTGFEDAITAEILSAPRRG
jgi:hypothetical protein